MININEMRQTVKEVCWLTTPFTVDELLELLDRLEAWENVFGHLGTPDEVGNEWHKLTDRLEAAEKERDALRNEIACVKEVEFPRKVQAVADAWKGKCERLEAQCDAAETEALEQARLNGMGAERELALMAKLEAAEKETKSLREGLKRMCLDEDEAGHDEGCCGNKQCLNGAQGEKK